MAWVTQPGVQVLYTLNDAAGHKTTMSVYMDGTETNPAAGGPLAVGAAIQGISANALTSVACRVRASESAPGAPTDGPYARGADKLKMVFQGEDGSPLVIEIGSPNEGTLQADKINVDTTDAAVIAFVAAMLANAVTAEGMSLTNLTYGYRRRPPRRKAL